MGKFNYLIVGAGLSGSTLARCFAETGKKVLVIDKRNHIGGNVFDYIDKKTGIRLSKYGAHIFHTNSDKVWHFVNRFSRWIPYEHRVTAFVNNQFVPIPVNITTVNRLLRLNIQSEEEMIAWLEKHQYKGEIKNSKDAALARVGEKLYKLLFENYTFKQWNKDPSELEPSVLERIPVRTNFYDRYFSDKYEALPEQGYTTFVKNLLNHENIRILLNTPYSKRFKNFKKVFFTGKIDGYFADKFGKLEYRSLKFDYETIKIENYQPTAVVNYPSLDCPFTRIVDYKKFYNQKSEYSVIAKEYSCDDGEPYYPVPSPRNRLLYEAYRQEASKQESQNVYFVGRLAEYKYYNMDQAILSALNLFEKLTNI
jgi:UDP-galactopyranose mutase